MTGTGARLVTVSPYGPGVASYRERIVAWADRLGPTLDQHCYFGVDGTASSFGPVRGPARSLAAERSLRRLRRASPPALIMHREASPFSTGRLESGLLAAAGRSAYDIDDALHADWGGDAVLRRVFAKAGKAAACAERASITVAGNEVVADWASTIADDVRIIPTCIEPEDYAPRADHALHDPPRLVWIGSPATVRYLDTIAAPLLAVHAEHGAELVVVGADVAGTVLAPMATAVSWSPAAQREWLAAGDVGVMPLADGPFERGKCGYKLLQYAAAGLPAVADPVGVNRALIDRFGLPAVDGPDDWYDALDAVLTESADQRAARAARAREAVVARYSFDAWEPAWRTLLDDLGVVVPPPG